MENESPLVRLCIEAASESREAVERWRRQHRTLERLPSPVSDALLRRLLDRRLLFPSLLEVFKLSVEVVDLRGENAVDAEWMAYLGAFRYLRYLNLADCHRISSSSLWALSGMSSLRELDLSRCGKVTDAGIRHLLSISALETLRIPETGLTANGVSLFCALKSLIVLDIGGLPVTDMALSSLQVLTKLQHLDLWGSKVSNKGVAVLELFPKLSFLNLGWTGVTQFPNLPSLDCLNLSNCSIESFCEGNGDKAPLTKLILSGATFLTEAEVFSNIEPSFLSFLDVSNSSFLRFDFLLDMKVLKHLDLSSCVIGDDSIEVIACIGANLINLNLSKTRVSSSGLAILAEHVPKLECLSLSHAPLDDLALSYIGMMLSLKIVDLSNTNIKGFIYQEDVDANSIPSLKALQGLTGLQSLNLEHVLVNDAAVAPVSSFQELSHLYLRSVSLTNETLHHLSSLSRLTNLAIGDAVLTDNSLKLFRPLAALKLLDLRGCWLLTEVALAEFSAEHPAIELRHELFLSSSSHQNSSYHRPRTLSTSPKVTYKQGKMPVPSSIPQHFIDQRLKYSREELLALQNQSPGIGSPYKRGLAMSNVQLDENS